MDARWSLMMMLMVSACGPSVSARWEAMPEDGPAAVLVVPNLDDDNADGIEDWSTPLEVDGEDDRATVLVANKKRSTVVSLAGDTDNVRVYHEGRLVLGADAPAAFVLPDRRRKDEVALEIEVATWGEVATLLVTDERKETTERLAIVGAAPTMGHHLLPTEQSWVVSLDFGFGVNNDDMLAVLTDELGDLMEVVDGPTYGDDPWMQDEPEFFRMGSPDAESTLILDSIRDGNGLGGLDPFPETFAGPDALVQTHGPINAATTYDAFGNLEVSPPVTVDGVEYPFGRIYYGWNGEEGGSDYGPHPDVRAFLASTGEQAPFAADTSWLCVGHIDEYTTFLPDPSAPRGFRFYIADTALGLQTLRQRDGDTPLMRHGRRGYRGHGRSTIASYTEDDHLIAYNEDLQRDHIEPALEVFKRELALTDEEIVRVPSFFEEVADDFGVCGAAAVIPGTVNLLMITDDDGEGGTAFLPDPFVRSEGESQDDDPFIQAWREILPDTVRPVFVDNWDVYHMGLGEVHCATNQRRLPAMARADLAPWLESKVGGAP